MGLLRNLRMTRAARRYARELPAALRKGWGASARYTPEQIAAAARRLGLDPEFIGIAYAAFLPLEAFEALIGGSSFDLTYDRARALFVRHLPGRRSTAPWGEAPDRSYELSMSDSGPAGGHHN